MGRGDARRLYATQILAVLGSGVASKVGRIQMGADYFNFGGHLKLGGSPPLNIPPRLGPPPTVRESA